MERPVRFGQRPPASGPVLSCRIDRVKGQAVHAGLPRPCFGASGAAQRSVHRCPKQFWRGSGASAFGLGRRTRIHSLRVIREGRVDLPHAPESPLDSCPAVRLFPDACYLSAGIAPRASPQNSRAPARSVSLRRSTAERRWASSMAGLRGQPGEWRFPGWLRRMAVQACMRQCLPRSVRPELSRFCPWSRSCREPNEGIDHAQTAVIRTVAHISRICRAAVTAGARRGTNCAVPIGQAEL